MSVYIFFLLGLVNLLEGAQGQISTGSRTWTFDNGKKERMLFTQLIKDQKQVIFDRGLEKGGQVIISLTKLSDKDQRFVDDLSNGRITLLQVPGLSTAPDFSNGKRDKKGIFSYHTVGPERKWKNNRGQTITARLINLTDEDVSLLVENSVSRVSLEKLAPECLKHLERVKAGEVLFAPEWISFNGFSWAGGKSYGAYIRGEELYQEQDIDTSFERGLNKALGLVENELGKTGWRFTSMESHNSLAKLTEIQSLPYDTKAKFRPLPAQRPLSFFAEFELEEKVVADARKAWPLNTSPPDWSGKPTLRLYFSPSGQPAVIETVHP